MKRLILYTVLLFCFSAWGQDMDDELSKFTPFIQALNKFSKNIPQEKVYLHFDNTGYYQGDNIWFKCYVVTSGEHQLSQWSKTLYVELLNPGGEVVDKRILKVENGQCHGEFTLNRLPFYSGFYEVRAYTKYMLNWGDEVIFSRLLPVFDKPKVEGNFEEKELLKYDRWGIRDYPIKRERPLKEKKVNLRFFPEGGNLVQGVTSRVAFEATDETGNPIEVTGVVMDNNKQELALIATLHEGRGIFAYTPPCTGKNKDVAEITCSGRKYRFDMPESLPQGIVMEVDNLLYPDSISVTLRKNKDMPAELLGVAVLCGGKLLTQNSSFIYMENEETGFQIEKAGLPSGVSQIVLFNNKGEILCDRLVFTNRNDFLNITAKNNKPVYQPLELVEMEMSVTDMEMNPVSTTFSLSVRDAANEVESKQNILTDLLLMSEIKGFVRNPSYYFEENDKSHRAALDLLLMVQGWRRYSWKQMAGIESSELKYFPEQGIDIDGKIVSLVRQKPQPNVNISLFLHKEGEEDEQGGNIFESFASDKQGRFSFISEVEGKWDMILTVREKGKKKNHRIILDRVFSPEPKRYRYADMQISVAGKNMGEIDEEGISGDVEVDIDSITAAYKDSLAKSGVNEKIHSLPEVTVKAKRNTKEQDIFRNRSTSVAYYDVPSEIDDVFDKGKYITNDIHALLKNMNKNFNTPDSFSEKEFLFYKGNKMALVIVDYKPVEWDNILQMFHYKTIRLPAIQSIYINENTSVIAQYLDLPFKYYQAGLTPIIFAGKEFSCVVFIETYPKGEIPAEATKGVRKTSLEGYSTVKKEFYSPDYSVLPLDVDYRRTLYWDPSVTTDENGKANIKFYNNSNCTDFSISAETITPAGMIGIYK